MGHPSGSPGTGAHLRQVRLRTVRPDGTPVVTYDDTTGRPAIGVFRLDDASAASAALAAGRHAHDFHVLLFVERGGGDAVVDGELRALTSGDLLAVPPGHVVGVAGAPFVGAAWALAFRADAVAARSTPTGWSRDPLLAAFRVDGVSHRRVPAAERATWVAWFADLERELADPAALGSAEAAVAIGTRLLVASARLAAPGTRTPPPGTDPLVGRLLDLVERRYAEPVGTADLARELGYTAGHLTTVVRRRTGRTVLEWLTERRLAEARRLLLDTDLPLTVVAGRVGYRDPAYLVRRFREAHGVTPQRWRRAARAPES